MEWMVVERPPQSKQTKTEDSPTMQKDQRNRILNLGLLVHEVNIERPKMINIDIRRELRHLIQLRFRFAPIEAVLPVLGELLDFR
jgi:hypothetical protein